MKTGTPKNENKADCVAAKMRALPPDESRAVILETAQDHRNLAAALYYLKKEGLKFKTNNGPNGTVNVWRIK